ncbi:MAG: efflux RND transporter periplasmic adaptor subunit [Nitrospinae bacterium]|nr:efflux RND transporter periplasmic adaptor subunit [Nitrospinota bacterium]
MNGPDTKTEAPRQEASPNHKRKRIISILLAGFALAGVAFGAYWLIIGRHYAYTDNAYVAGNIVQVEPQAAGTVVAIYADETDMVEKGQLLIKIGDADASVALDQAKAELAQTVRKTRKLFEQVEELKSALALRKLETERLAAEYQRRKELVADRAVSEEDYGRSKAAWEEAVKAEKVAEKQLAGAVALAGAGKLEIHPDVQGAKARVMAAYLNLARSEIRSPVTGHVAKRNAQLGGRIAPGKPVISVVPLDQLWVDANFKETQLHDIRVGQQVEITSDLHGDGVKYHGKVISLGAGTGSVFSILPPQNATGNWIKIVQRAPVRISLEPERLKEHPLILGLSLQVTVDTHDLSGAQLAGRAKEAGKYATDIYQRQSDGAADMINGIIRENLAP